MQLYMEQAAQILKALGDESRLQIVALLLRFGELCVCDFEGALRFSQSKSSRHLRYLLNAGLVENRRDGQWLHYRIKGDLAPAQKKLLASVETLLPEVQVEALEQQMRAWLDRKQCDGGCS